MSKTAETIACPICGTELTLAQLLTHEDTRLAFERLAAVSIPLGARVLGYITLFAPPKTRLTIAKQVKLILQLLPDLERQGIAHKGREWAAPLSAWAVAIDQMMAARDIGRLELPMTGHGYLYSILVGMADKHEASMERKQEEERRNGPRQTAPASTPPETSQPASRVPAAAAGPAGTPFTSAAVRAFREELARKGGKDDA